MSIRLFYDRRPQYNRRITEIIAPMTDEQLAIRPSPEHLPMWPSLATWRASESTGSATCWGEPGAESTPFTDPDAAGWEDDLDHPRTAAELVGRARRDVGHRRAVPRPGGPKNQAQSPNRPKESDAQSRE
jgi:hypothetical protein